MKSEMCSSCTHTKVCFKDKNILGDVFVPGNPMLFDNQERFKEYEKRKADGFPCDDYMAAPISKPATNADALRAMTDEELARFATGEDFCELLCGAPTVCDGNCEGKMLSWLKAPVEEVDNG